eukprot:CCRYP_018120-RA/>CCRYP_018120-RA protein AED:0.13 eAED:0.12 QI:0/0/0/1/0/0/2/0/105
MSVGTEADNGYTVVFSPWQQGVTVYCGNDVIISPNVPPALQGWRDKRGLLILRIANNLNPETAMNVYELPSTKECIRYLHVAFGFPTKATLLSAERQGNPSHSQS